MSYFARALPGGSTRLCQCAGSVRRRGRMCPSRVRVICCVSRQKILYSNSTTRDAHSLRVSFRSSYNRHKQNFTKSDYRYNLFPIIFNSAIPNTLTLTRLLVNQNTPPICSRFSKRWNAWESTQPFSRTSLNWVCRAWRIGWRAGRRLR